MQDQENDKYDASDDEYQFEDDMSYEDVDDSATSASPTVETETTGNNPLANLTRSKRMMIGLGAFLGLVFVVYKMVSPTGSSAPTTDFTSDSPMMAQQPLQPSITPPPQQQVAQPAQQIQQPTQQVAQQPAQMSQPAAQQPVTQQQYPSQQVAQTQAPVAQQMQQPQQMQQMATAAQQLSGQAQAQVAAAQQQVQQQYAAQQQQPSNQQSASSIMQQMMAGAASGVAQQQQASQPTQAYQGSGYQQPAQQQQQPQAQLPPDYNGMNTRSDMDRLVSGYEQQNKNLESQVDVLNKRVASMESEISQLIRTLTEHYEGAPSASTGGASSTGQGMGQGMAAQQQQMAPAKPTIPYAVQAIIPGRAWLRSNSGDTVTVTEGDEIKGVGRVTKIDPYDGVVQIDVRGQTISLSYGAGS